MSAYSLLMGSALEMVLLSFALADKINAVRLENEPVQRRSATEHALVMALRKSQDNYQAVIEQVGEGMVIIQNDRFVFANAQALQILACSLDAIIREGLIAQLLPEDQPLMATRLHARLAGTTLPRRIQCRRP